MKKKIDVFGSFNICVSGKNILLKKIPDSGWYSQNISVIFI